MPLVWSNSIDHLDWSELAALYRVAPLGNKTPDGLKTAFTNSMFKCFVHEEDKLVGVGRALAGLAPFARTHLSFLGSADLVV